jgi:hypothetical protein
MARLKRKGEDWWRKLPRKIVIRNGKTLATLGDCGITPFPWMKARLI